MQINDEILERSIASFLGFAIGDALGATTEFMTEREIKCTYGIHKKIVGGGWLHLKAGDVTDDTEMALALGDSIIENNSFSKIEAAKYFLKWMQSKPVDIGSTVRRGIVHFKKNNNCEMPYSDEAAGNGACMRNLPIILYSLKKWNVFSKYTIEQCHITHNNIHSDLITLAFGEITKILILYKNKELAYQFSLDFIKRYPKYSFINYSGENSGYIIDTFKIVLYYFFNCNNFYNTLISVVNKGGDSDTNAALAGMLAGAFYGMNGLHKKWLKKLNKKVKEKIIKQTIKLLNIP